MATLSLFPARVAFVDNQGRLTPEAYRALNILFERVGGSLGDAGVDVFGGLVGAGTQDTALTDTVMQQPSAMDQTQDMIAQSLTADLQFPDVIQPTSPTDLDFAKAWNGLTMPKTSGSGIKVDLNNPTFGWRDLLGAITVKGAGGGGMAANPDYVAYRGGIYAYRFGTTAPNNHNHECFIEYHIPHDFVPGGSGGEDTAYIHLHWSQTTVDTGGTAGVPGVAKWYFEITYADGHGTPGGAADPFVAPITVSITQQASTTQYGHMIAEVAFANSGGTAGLLNYNTIQIDGLILVRAYRDPGDAADTLNKDTFVHFVDIHYQSNNMATKNKSPNFYG